MGWGFGYVVRPLPVDIRFASSGWSRTWFGIMAYLMISSYAGPMATVMNEYTPIQEHVLKG